MDLDEMGQAHAAYGRLRQEDPEGWQSLLDEIAEWDVTTGDGLGVTWTGL